MKGGDALVDRVRQSIIASINAKNTLLSTPDLLSEIAACSETLIEAMRSGRKLVTFGNGGSAADAQHIAAEFVGRFAFDRPALPALALSANSSCVTAIGNDYGYDLVFARQVEALGCVGDVALGISTSGKSANVLRALDVAREHGLHTVAMTGANGAHLRCSVEHCLCVPINETPRIQECHILIGHIISELVESAIFEGAVGTAAKANVKGKVG